MLTIAFYVFPFFSENTRVVTVLADSAFIKWQRRLTPLAMLALVGFASWNLLRAYWAWSEGATCPALLAQTRYIMSALLAVQLLFMRRFYSLLRRNAAGYLAFQRSARERDETELIEGFQIPPLSIISPYLDLYGSLLRARFYNVSNVPRGAALLAGNHSLGGLEIPLIVHHVFRERGVFLRGMADRLHDKIPLWGGLLHTLGVMGGSRERCRRCLRSGQPVLTFPGGAREMLKKKSDEKYSLHWGSHAGFARLAIETGVPIVPLVTVGVEDMLEVVADVPVSAILGKDLTAPVIKIPGRDKLQRIYIAFLEPIPTEKYRGDTSELNVYELRDRTLEAIKRGIEFLKEEQQNDPERFLFPRSNDDDDDDDDDSTSSSSTTTETKKSQ